MISSAIVMYGQVATVAEFQATYIQVSPNDDVLWSKIISIIDSTPTDKLFNIKKPDLKNICLRVSNEEYSVDNIIFEFKNIHNDNTTTDTIDISNGVVYLGIYTKDAPPDDMNYMLNICNCRLFCDQWITPLFKRNESRLTINTFITWFWPYIGWLVKLDNCEVVEACVGYFEPYKYEYFMYDINTENIKYHFKLPKSYWE